MSKFIEIFCKKLHNVGKERTKLCHKILTNHKIKNHNYLSLFLMFSSGYLAYKAGKRYSLAPSVSATSDFGISFLGGRRRRYNFIADVVETSAPAVVYIAIKDHRRVDFFTGKPMTISNGSGFIIDTNGLILTNAHVVTNRTNVKVEVKLIDGSTFQGHVEDIDLKSDLATVRIQANGLPSMKLGSSSDLRPGEFVVAIGSPLTLSNTVTSGVVSSIDRGSAELGLKGKDMFYIQTDAAVTFGNSGGPLVNLDGEAIGVNSLKVTEGISFAIPIDYARTFLKAAKGPKKTSNQMLYMGITMLTLTPPILHELQERNRNIPKSIDRGVLICIVIDGSPAYQAGLQPGDIVTQINGKKIEYSEDIYRFLEDNEVRQLKVSVTRSGRSMQLTMIPEDLS